jgi:hypothetical protein
MYDPFRTLSLALHVGKGPLLLRLSASIVGFEYTTFVWTKSWVFS